MENKNEELKEKAKQKADETIDKARKIADDAKEKLKNFNKDEAVNKAKNFAEDTKTNLEKKYGKKGPLLVIVGIVLIVGILFSFSGGNSHSKPPKYDGESMEQFGEKVGNWFTDITGKLQPKIIKEFSKKSKIFDENFKKDCNVNLDKKALLKCFDNYMEKDLKLSNEYLHLNKDDFKYIAGPADYYNQEDELAPTVFAVVNGLAKELLSTIAGMTMQLGYDKISLPTYLASDLQRNINASSVGYNKNYCTSNQGKTCQDRWLKKHKIDEKYYYVLTHSKYKDLIPNTKMWIENYKESQGQ